ncbi:transketolase [Candidatus Aerophobetes bacterium]|uniref:Transketolase n=1 Tax=Aerophobetes bacterium TaxID=2030807 RepID=A0A662DGX3_UNCAE|nr:MAG: transketolase [Candidatus Aerophobetes bacterium]
MVKLTSSEKADLTRKAAYVRRKVVEMICKGKGGHLGGALSCVEILITLYFKILRLDPERPYWDERDRFILSAGHKCLALYATMALRGFFDEEKLFTYGSLDSPFPGLPDRHKLSGIEANTGSLGHGLAIGGGMALAAKLDRKDWKVYVLLGDGEIAEGSIWEAAAAASHHKLDNLVAIVDKNKLQIQGPTSKVMNLDPLREKWKAFGWQVREIDGHSFDEIFTALTDIPFKRGFPAVIIANTVKGKGLSFAEDNPKFHQWQPAPGECEKALTEIKRLEETQCSQ